MMTTGESHKDLEIAELSRRLEEADKKLWTYESLEGAVCPPGMGFKEYFEMLELRIEKFKDFIRHEQLVAYRRSFEYVDILVCRFCKHPFDPNNSREARVDPNMHYGTCPLSVALQK